MKVVTIIPSFNEEETIGKVISEIPRDVADEVKVIVVDDGSTDNTSQEAKDAGADKIVRFEQNKGLAQAFRIGMEEALYMNADVIVNIDADGQYNPTEITKLINPIVEGEADLVLGSRFKGWIEYMPIRKKIGNILATKVTGFLSGLPVSDAQTGFRALSRETALRLNIFSEYTYTQEMIIQAAHKDLRVIEVPCTFRKRLVGESRLISNMFIYAKRAGLTILRTYRDYKPLRTFLLIGGVMSVIGFIVGLRVLIHFLMTGVVTPYLPSAILTAVLLIVGFQIMVLGLIADMIGINRRLMEEIIYKIKSGKQKEDK